MICLYDAEHAELLAARAERDEYVKARSERSIVLMARELVDEAARRGQVLTIEQRPLQPLAMGHHESVVSIREARR